MTELKRNLKLVIAYNGMRYHGWQRQAPGIDTVQGRVETAAIAVLKHPLHVHGASRTDSGVHAEGQVANIRTANTSIPFEGLRLAMNSRLPKDILIRSVEAVPMTFDASSSAVSKTYRYRINLGRDRLPHLAGQVYHYWQPLDIDVMRAAAQRLVGTHDFRGLANSGDRRENTVRTIFRCDLETTDIGLDIFVHGDGFLYNMVRIIVGTLLSAGRGKFGPEHIDYLLESGDRHQAGKTISPDGLTLMQLFY